MQNSIRNYEFFSETDNRRKHFNKGEPLTSAILSLLIAYPVLLIILIYSYVTNYSNSRVEIFIIPLSIILFVYALIIYFSIVVETKIDSESLYLRKQREFITIPLSDIEEIKYSPSIVGLHKFRIKRKGKIETPKVKFFRLFVKSQNEKDQLNSFLLGLGHVITLKKAGNL